MLLYEYIQLSVNERADVLWDNGWALDHMKHEGKQHSLYSLFDFYVEVTFTGKGVEDVMPFRQGVRLDKYLDRIKLDL